MPITWRVNDRTGWIDITFSDPYTLNEAERAMKDVFAQLGLSRPLRFLIDVRGSTPPDSGFVINATTFWQLHAGDMWGAKVAIVTANDRQKAKAQLSGDSAASRELPFTVRVFEDSEFDAATMWLQPRT